MRTVKKILKRTTPPCVVNTAREMRKWVNRLQQDAFDRRFKVDTAGIIQTKNLDVDEQGKQSGNHYEATPRRIFLRMLRSIQVDYPRFTFLDIGSGKGAVLLYASEYPFKQVIGVEYSSRLHHIAKTNIQTYKQSRTSGMKCHDVISICADATTYSLPNAPLVVYLANPFNEEMMARMVANIHRSLLQSPRMVLLLSFNPDVELVLDRYAWLERMSRGWNHCIYRAQIH